MNTKILIFVCLLVLTVELSAKKNKSGRKLVKKSAKSVVSKSGFNSNHFWKVPISKRRNPKLFDCPAFSMCEPVSGSGNFVRDGTKFRCCKKCGESYKKALKNKKNGKKKIHRGYRCLQDAFKCLCNCQCTLKG